MADLDVIGNLYGTSAITFVVRSAKDNDVLFSSKTQSIENKEFRINKQRQI